MKKKIRPLLLVVVVLAALLALAASPSTTSANHAWNDYHWARMSNPFTVKLGNNTSGLWTGMLGTASSDWSQSTVLDTTVVAGGTQPKSCRPTNGRDEICNANYHNTGWLGLAQIWLTTGDHIVQGVVKNNDYYFGSSSYPYNNTAEMQHVICQEIGHTFGLDHQSTDGSSLNTCMDYYHNTSNTDTKSTRPNQHDYDELAIIYQHLDSFTTVGAAAGAQALEGSFESPSEWGKLISAQGRSRVYERDLGKGEKLITLVILVE